MSPGQDPAPRQPTQPNGDVIALMSRDFGEVRMRRILSFALAAFAATVLTAGRAEALSVRDVIELSKAGLGEEVLLALIEVDPSIFAIDAATLKQLKSAGVPDRVIVAMIKSGRTSRPDPPPAQESQP